MLTWKWCQRIFRYADVASLTLSQYNSAHWPIGWWQCRSVLWLRVGQVHAHAYHNVKNTTVTWTRSLWRALWLHGTH